ncbi:hypothetical protein NC652_006908 [Populus alba x Populus x berolinensis]|nr:hypothetical protein NC652_006908 [Populus alba x Populus x berolinensis]
MKWDASLLLLQYSVTVDKKLFPNYGGERECHPLSLISSDNYREEGNKQGETEREKNSHWIDCKGQLGFFISFSLSSLVPS